MKNTFMLPHRDTYTFKLIKVNKNSAYTYGDNENSNNTEIIFKGRPSNNSERKSYRITKGVNGASDSVMIICTNLPDIIEVGDKIEGLGHIWTVENVGFYYMENRFINGGLFSDKQLMDRCPKGLTLS